MCLCRAVKTDCSYFPTSDRFYSITTCPTELSMVLSLEPLYIWPMAPRKVGLKDNGVSQTTI